VKAIVNASAIAGFRLPGIVGIVQRFALVLFGKINNGGRPTYGGSAAAGEKIVARNSLARRIFKMGMRINPARYHHTASRVDDVRV